MLTRYTLILRDHMIPHGANGSALRIVPSNASDRCFHDFASALRSLSRKGAKRDVLVILLANALIIPVCKRVSLSPVLGFLAAGVVLGPNCLSIVSDVKAIEVKPFDWLVTPGRM